MRDNGRGIPVDPHPKFKNLSALEVILTTLHSGGKFGGKVYATSGGLHGVGSSVVNALSEAMEVEVARDRMLWKQSYARGKPTTQADQRRAGAQPPRHLDPLQAGPEVFGAIGVQPGAAVPAVPVQGLPVPRRADPLGLRPVAAGAPRTTRRPRRCCTSPAGCATAWRRISASRPVVLPQPWAGEADLARRRRPGGMGRRLAGAGRGLPPLLLQHHPDHPGRHA